MEKESNDGAFVDMESADLRSHFLRVFVAADRLAEDVAMGFVLGCLTVGKGH